MLVEKPIRELDCHLNGLSDMHLKIFPLLEMVETSDEYTLSLAYDLLSINGI